MSPPRTIAFVAIAILLVAIASPVGAAVTGDGTTSLISRRPDGSAASNGSLLSSISDDGRMVAFESPASDLVPDDTNNRWDVFLHDRDTGQTTMLSRSPTGEPGNWHSFLPSISGDGRQVAFVTAATNVAVGTEGRLQIVLMDVATGDRVVVSDGPEIRARLGHEQGYYYGSAWPRFSADGTQLAFAVGPCIGGIFRCTTDLWVWDLTTASVELVVPYVVAEPADISGTGRWVTFSSAASDLVPDDTNETDDIFVLDRSTGTYERASVDSLEREARAGGEGYGSYLPVISGDGRYVAFMSYSNSMIANGDTPHTQDIFLRDRVVGATHQLSTGCGQQPVLGQSRWPWISADGRFVVFWSDANGVEVEDTNGFGDLFVVRTSDRTRRMLSVNTIGEMSDDISSEPADLTPDGGTISFASAGSNLAPGDDNGYTDVFVREITGWVSDGALGFDPPGEHTTNVNKHIAVTVCARHPNGGAVTYRATSLPSGARMFENGLFSWTPGITQWGTFHIPLVARSSFGDEDTATLTIRVRSPIDSILCELVFRCEGAQTSRPSNTPGEGARSPVILAPAIEAPIHIPDGYIRTAPAPWSLSRPGGR